MSVEERPNRKWRARVYDASGKQIARHFDRTSDAERWASPARAAVGRATGSIRLAPASLSVREKEKPRPMTWALPGAA
jgi:hypothetical protein